MNIEEVVKEIRNGIDNRETCGLLSSSFKLYPVENISASPFEFIMEKLGYVKAVNLILKNKEYVAAVYHTHPFSDAAPSAKDLDYFDKSAYDMLIVSREDYTYHAKTV